MKENWIQYQQLLEPLIKRNYETHIREFKNGDFGDLIRIEFSGRQKTGGIELWSSGYISFHLVDLKTSEEMINQMFMPEEKEQIALAFQEFKKLVAK